MDTISNCAFCGNDDFSFITDKGDKFAGEQVNFCNNCGLLFLSPRTSNISDYYYTDSFSEDFRGEASPSEEKQAALHDMAAHRWNSVEPFVKNGGTLLEIGCSSGAFLLQAKEHMDVYGVDPSTGFAKHNKDLNVHVGEFPEWSFQEEVEKFDAICVFHVLEHVPDPIAFLESVYDRLADDGVFVLEYPDIMYAVLRPYLEDSYFQKSHFYDFSSYSLLPVLTDIGFGVYNFGKYDDFPRDKNAFAIIRKRKDGDSSLTSSNRPIRMKNAILAKLKAVNFLNDNNLTICHIASHNINVGDGAITEGVRKFLREIPANLNIVNFDIVDFERYNQHLAADEINSLNPDLVIVGGGGTIDGHKSRVHTGTALQLPVEEIEKINAPLAFWGLGHNVFPGQEAANMDILDMFVKYCESKGFPFSVRRDLSKERLSSVLSKEAWDYIQEVPDPGFFVPTDGVPYALSPEVTRQNAILQVALDSTKHRFGDTENLDNFVDKIAQLMMHLVENKTDVTLTLHTLFDGQIVNIYKMFLDDHKSRNLLRTNTRILGVSHPLYAPQFFSNYANADIVIGMRGHSVICGTGLRIPTVALSTHDKVSGYMEEIGCSDWCFELDFEYEDLIAQVDDILNIEGAVRQKAIVMEHTSDWESQSRDFAYQCLNLV